MKFKSSRHTKNIHFITLCVFSSCLLPNTLYAKRIISDTEMANAYLAIPDKVVQQPALELADKDQTPIKESSLAHLDSGTDRQFSPLKISIPAQTLIPEVKANAVPTLNVFQQRLSEASSIMNKDNSGSMLMWKGTDADIYKMLKNPDIQWVGLPANAELTRTGDHMYSLRGDVLGTTVEVLNIYAPVDISISFDKNSR